MVMYLEDYKNVIQDLCKNYHVHSLYAFGSVLTDRFNDESDIDMIVSFNKIPLENHADNYFDLKFTLQDVLQRPIDLLEEQAIKNPFFLQNINRNKQLIYG
jgi:predicted nucleotidyltransferase